MPSWRELERLLQGTALLRELTPRVLDAISGMGERLSAPLLAGAISELGVRSVSVSRDRSDRDRRPSRPRRTAHGRNAAERAEARLRPLLKDGVVPVVTGFIGATVEGVPTTSDAEARIIPPRF